MRGRQEDCGKRDPVREIQADCGKRDPVIKRDAGGLWEKRSSQRDIGRLGK